MSYASHLSYGGNPQFDNYAMFADPFADMASVAMPSSVPAMLRHAEFFSVAQETLRAAFNRVSAYFLTNVKVIGELGDDEKEKHLDYLQNDLGIIEFLHTAAIDYLTYGVQYTSVFKPFVRYVICPRPGCGVSYRLGEFNSRPEYQYQWANGIRGRCPACGYSGVFADKNRRPHDVEDESKPLHIHRWNPHDIRIVWVEATRRAAAFNWQIPGDVRSEMRNGTNKAAIAETPWEWVVAALEDKNVQFTPEQIHYWADPALAGLRFRGVGVPRSIINYRLMFYIQVLRRMNEALALGHVVPIRVISPAGTPSGSADPSGNILKLSHLGDLKGRVMGMVNLHRRDPNSIHYSPVPLQMQALGADARQLIPNDIMNQALETLLNGIDCPVDFYRLSMQTQAAPVALRLLDRAWSPFNAGRNRLLGFIGRRAQYLKRWEKARYELEPVDVVDNIENSMLLAQLGQAGTISRTTVLKNIKKDFKEESRQKIRDIQIEQELQAEAQEEQDTFAFGKQVANAGPPLMAVPGQPGAAPGAQGAPGQPGAAPPQAGDPAQGGMAPDASQAAGIPAGSDPLQSMLPQPGQNMDPQEWLGRAQAAAKYLLGVPEGQRFGMLQHIKDVNPLFHQIVKGQLEQMRSKARSQGQQIVMSQGGPQ